MNPRRLLDPVAEAPGREVGRTPHPGAQGKANFAMQAMLAIGQMYGGARSGCNATRRLAQGWSEHAAPAL